MFRHNKKVLDTSALGLVREDGDFHSGLDILGIDGPLPVTDSYTMYQGKRKKIHYTANRYTVHLRNSKDMPMDIIMARQKDSTWYVVGINEEGKEKEFTVDLSFLGPKKGMLITDGNDGHLEYKGIDLEKTPVQVLKMKPFGDAVLKF